VEDGFTCGCSIKLSIRRWIARCALKYIEGGLEARQGWRGEEHLNGN
jgi:hypothetical protein